MHQAHSHQCFRTPFFDHCFHPEISNAVVPVIHVLIDTIHVRAAAVASNDAVVLFTHTPTHDEEYAHCITNSRTNQHHFATSSTQTRQSKGTPGLQLSHNIQFRLSRLCSGCEPCSPRPSVTRNFSKPFSTSYFNLLVSSSSRNFCLLHHPINFRTATVFLITCDGGLVGLVLGRYFQVLSRFCHTDWR